MLQGMEQEPCFTGEETKVPEGQGVQARSEPTPTDSKAEGLLSAGSVLSPLWFLPACAPVSPPHVQTPSAITQLLAQPRGAGAGTHVRQYPADRHNRPTSYAPEGLELTRRH